MGGLDDIDSVGAQASGGKSGKSPRSPKSGKGARPRADTADSQEGATQETDASAEADQSQQGRLEQSDPNGKDTMRPKKSITGSSSEQDIKAQMTSFKRELAIGKQSKKNLTKSIKELEKKIKKMTH